MSFFDIELNLPKAFTFHKIDVMASKIKSDRQ